MGIQLPWESLRYLPNLSKPIAKIELAVSHEIALMRLIGKIYMFERIDLSVDGNQNRFYFIHEQLRKIEPCKLLDVGAGERPFKEPVIKLGFKYVSHDFEQYAGEGSHPGLQNSGWDNQGHDIVSDILTIPRDKFGAVLLTEVLEHVPDPVKALAKCSDLLEANGTLLVTVPFASRMHQSPFWFSSGLSPYWFEHHAKELGLQVVEIQLLGNFYDMFLAEGEQFFGCFGYQKNTLGRIFIFVFNQLRTQLERRIPKPLLESGALGVFVVLKKI